ncbi:Hpt domain-containing protein, partial [Novosphingobium sp. 1949]
MSPEEIQQIFFVECEESLAAAEAGLAACQAGTQDSDTVNGVFRAVHSIKGGAGAFGFTALQAYTHTFETLLSDVREGLVAIEHPLVDLLLRALDTLADHVTCAREGGDEPDDAALIAEMEGAMAANAGKAAAEPAPAEPPAETVAQDTGSDRGSGTEEEDEGFGIDLDSLLDDLTADFAPPPSGEASAEASSWKLHLRPRAGAMRNGSEPLLMLRDVVELGGSCIHCDVSQIPQLDGFDVAQGYLGWTFAMPADVGEDTVREIFDFIGDDCALAIGEDAEIPEVEATESLAPPAVASAPEPEAPAPAAAAPDS